MEKRDRPLWSLPIKEVLNYFKSSEKGLSEKEAKRRLEEYGYNDISTSHKRHVWNIFLAQFTNALVLVLIAAAIIAYLLGEHVDSLVIFSILLINAALGFFQEYKAERSVAELQKYLIAKTKVIRNGELVEIDSRELVPGDILHLSIGDVVPADIRLFKSHSLYVDESSLTGESVPVLKKVGEIAKKNVVAQDLFTMTFMGTTVTSGSAFGIVTETGLQTFFGKTAQDIETISAEGDLQKNMRKFSTFLLKVILGMTVFVFIVNALMGKGIFDSLLFAIALAVGITPEVLPIIMTISLSHGALRMAKEKVVIKKLSAVEDLGNMDTLCCDKTGTLTEGVLSLQQTVDAEGKRAEHLLLYGLLCSDTIGNHVRTYNNPLDKALWKSKNAPSFLPSLKEYEILTQNDFDFFRKRMSVLVQHNKEKTLIVKGASEKVVALCTHVYIGHKKVAISKHTREDIHQRIINYELNGYKTIALAQKFMTKSSSNKNDEDDLTLLGFFLFLDPPKKTVRESLHMLEELHVAIKVISGDSPIITKKICEDVGLPILENRVITGEELESLSDKKIEEYAQKYNVFARVTPTQKYKLVAALNKEEHVVGFLGDGINDAPALKAADIGISAESATGIARESADIILLTKSLRVLAHGIAEGRKTFGNIMKYITITISSNYGNMFTVAISSLFLPFIPMLPAQILLVNFLSDAPNLTISTDNVDQHTLKKPKKWNIQLISKLMIYFGLISSFFDLLLIFLLVFLLHVPTDLFRTAWFTESVLTELVIIFSLRTAIAFYKSKPSTWLLVTSVLASLLTVGITYTLFGYIFFQFVSLPFGILGLTLGLVLVYFFTVEIVKLYLFKRLGFLE